MDGWYVSECKALILATSDTLLLTDYLKRNVDFGGRWGVAPW